MFKDFKFKPKLSFAIKRAGFREPSPIQSKAIPPILKGKNVVGQAHTGTGKTAAFALPLLERMSGDKAVETLVIVPTRELATQVSDEFYKFGRHLGIRSATIYGGVSYRSQIERTKTAQVIVATPGRLLDLLTREKIQINPRFVVLDEADEMLSMGFIEDIRNIFQFLEGREQTLMFSATIPEVVKELADTLMKDPLYIHTEKETLTATRVKQFYYLVEEHERDRALVRLLETYSSGKSIVFCRTKKETERVADTLSGQGFSISALHGDMEQRERQIIMKGFRRGNFDILVATDVAARGIDVRGVERVINYHIPFDPESYVHRIGRTGRARRSGVAMTLVTPHEFSELERIQNVAGSQLRFERIPQRKMEEKEIHYQLKNILEKERIQKDTSLFIEKFLSSYTSLSREEILSRLLSFTIRSFEEEDFIGKTSSDLKSLLLSDKREGKTTSHQKGRKQHDAIPKPKLKKIGSSRIVARKIFKK